VGWGPSPSAGSRITAVPGSRLVAVAG
jgi:hypothetical protein